MPKIKIDKADRACIDCSKPILLESKRCISCANKAKNNIYTNQFREKLRVSKIGEKNPQWVGDRVGISGIHAWIKRRLKRPTKCTMCWNNPAHDLANISQDYKRDLSDWEWLCRKCHMLKDGRIKNLKQYAKEEN